MANVVFSNFTANVAPSLSANVIGYFGETAGSEQRWTHAVMRALYTSGLTSANISNFNTAASAAAPVQSVAGQTGAVDTIPAANISGLGTAATTNASDYATAAQGALADSAVQPGSLANVATSGAYGDLSGLPTLGTAAATNSDAYATAAQGALADSAVQPGSLANVATTGAYGDLSGTPTIPDAIFVRVAVTGQDNIDAASANDVLTIAAGSNVTVTTNATTKTVTIAAAGGGGGGGGLADPGANGIVVRTAENVTTARTIEGGNGVTVANGNGVSANPSVSVANASTTVLGIVELATDGQTDAGVAVQGNDGRLSNARTPTAHASTHTNGTDDIQDATASQKGLMSSAYASKLDGIATGANNYAHPNHTGHVTSAGDGATTISANVVTDSMISPSAGILLSKLAVNPLDRANHTGTQAANTVTGLANVATSGNVVDLTGTIPVSLFPAGDGLQVLRRNSANTALEFATISAGGGDMTASNNLSELTDVAAARTNLGLGTMAVETASNYLTTSAAAAGYQPLATVLTNTTAAFTTTQETKLAGIAENANNYSHPNHTGDVTSTGDGATAIASGVIVNDDINASAAIALSKLATDPLARANHTGTQTASTISDFDTAVAANSAVAANTAKVSNATHTGDVTGATELTIANDAVTNAKAANMAEATIKGRAAAAGTGDPTDLTATQVRTILNVADGATANAGTVTSVAVSGSDGIEIDSGSPITGAGTIALGVNAATLRSHINVADGANNYTLPVAGTTTIGGVKRNAGTAGQYVTGVSDTGDLQYDTPAGGGEVTLAGAETLSNKTLAGYTLTAPVITAETVVSGTEVDVTKPISSKAISNSTVTLTFSATPSTGASFILIIRNTDTEDHTITLPSVFSEAQGASVTEFSVGAESALTLAIRREASRYVVYGDAVSDLPAQVSGGEITAGTETALRSYSPADIVAFIDEHAAAGGGAGLHIGISPPTDPADLFWFNNDDESEDFGTLYVMIDGTPVAVLGSGGTGGGGGGGGGDLSATDIDTLAELNAILTDATLIDTGDSRLSDARTPTAHASTHVTGGSDKIRDATASQDGLMTSAYATKLDGIATSANNYTHPNHTGDVTSTGDGATVIANDAVTNAKMANMAEATIKGRAAAAGTGDPTDLTPAQARTVMAVAEATGFAKMTVGTTAPTSPGAGDLWVDTN